MILFSETCFNDFVFTISSEGNYKFCYKGNLLGCGNWTKSNFDYLNLFQSQQLSLNMEHWLKLKLTWLDCTMSIKLKQNGATAITAAKNLKMKSFWVKTWELVFSGGE